MTSPPYSHGSLICPAGDACLEKVLSQVHERVPTFVHPFCIYSFDQSSWYRYISSQGPNRCRRRSRLHCVVNFPSTWINAARFETALRNSCGPHASNTHEVTIEFPLGCKIMVDGAIRILSLANQLAFSTRRVRLNFEEGEAGTMGYLNRMGFFDHLRSDIEVMPSRPFYSAALIHRGGNSMLVEIELQRGVEKPLRGIGPF